MFVFIIPSTSTASEQTKAVSQPDVDFSSKMFFVCVLFHCVYFKYIPVIGARVMKILTCRLLQVPDEFLSRPMGELVSYFRSVTSSSHEFLRIAYSWIIHRSEDIQIPTTDSDPEIAIEYTSNDEVKLTRNQLLGELLR